MDDHPEPAGPVWQIEIEGDPVPQPRAVVIRKGARYSVGTPRTIGKGTILGRRPHPIIRYKETIRRAAEDLMDGLQPVTCPIDIETAFTFPRPKSPTKADRARWKTGRRYLHTKAPDGDNLEKAVFDALTGILWADDCQIASGSWTKWVAGIEDRPGVVIRIQLWDNLQPAEIVRPF